MEILGLAGAGRAEGEEEKLVLLQGRVGTVCELELEGDHGLDS